MNAARPFRTATTAEFPLIDVGPYLAGEPAALERTGAEVRDALANLGFMMFRNTGIPRRLIDGAFAASRRFHALPLDEKMALKVNRHQIGYVPMAYTFNEAASVDGTKGLRRDASENLTFYQERSPDDPKVVAGERFRGLNQWPPEERLPGFRRAMVDYHMALMTLGYRLLPLFARALGMPAGYFDTWFRDPTCVIRMVRYPAVGELRTDQFGSASHTDAGFFTMLPQADEPGLQIQTPDGEWVDQPIVDDAFVVNSGNMLKQLSNDLFKATPHRVTTAVDRDRHSLAFFFNPDLDDIIAPVSSCVSSERPAKYQPVVYRDWYTWYLEKTYAHYQRRDAAE
ncbi:MAG: isopenicillin N synthase family dioxygenase [Alphaproteobacteria bacterium]